MGTRRSEIDLAFEKFDLENPTVWDYFVLFTNQLIKKGFQHYSSDAVLHRVRWETDISTGKVDGFKLNNNFSSRYARKFHKMYPQHDGFFRTRVLTSQWKLKD